MRDGEALPDVKRPVEDKDVPSVAKLDFGRARGDRQVLGYVNHKDIAEVTVCFGCGLAGEVEVHATFVVRKPPGRYIIGPVRGAVREEECLKATADPAASRVAARGEATLAVGGTVEKADATATHLACVGGCGDGEAVVHPRAVAQPRAVDSVVSHAFEGEHARTAENVGFPRDVLPPIVCVKLGIFIEAAIVIVFVGLAAVPSPRLLRGIPSAQETS